MPQKHTAPRAICTAKIATIHNGQRIVRQYESNERPIGTIADNDAPPFTGYVRGWFGKKGSKQ